MNNKNKIIHFQTKNILKKQPLSHFQTPLLFYIIIIIIEKEKRNCNGIPLATTWR